MIKLYIFNFELVRGADRSQRPARLVTADSRVERADNCDRSQILPIARALSIFLHRVVVWGSIARQIGAAGGSRACSSAIARKQPISQK